MVASGEEGSGIASTHADLREEVPAALAPLETENRLFLSHYTANATDLRPTTAACLGRRNLNPEVLEVEDA